MNKSKGSKQSPISQDTLAPTVSVIPENEHPDFIAGRFSDADDIGTNRGTPSPDTNTNVTISGSHQLPDPLPLSISNSVSPQPLPLQRPFEAVFPVFCGAVSGRYRMVPTRPPVSTEPFPSVNLMSMTVRVDVDRFFPQNRISIEVNRLIPNIHAHVIAEVTSDSCLGYNRRTIVASINYRDGNAALIPGTTVTFRALRTNGFGYGAYELTLSGGGITPKTYGLSFESIYFDKIEFEVDQVDNAGTVITSYDTHAHPNRSSGLPAETLALTTIFQRAGFEATMSSGGGVISVSGAGANGTWSDAEMHNAMLTYWSRFANNPLWAMWVLYAARHDMGRSLGGIMFDDIGPNHRQGTAIFTNSFIQDVPVGDANPEAWRNRMQFWTAIHEMGHGFNLSHSWQKALGMAWMPLANEPEARSFMNYPNKVVGGQTQFFSNFQFRFSDDELVFMRHAPRRFVQMGNSNWFDNHGFEAPEAFATTGNWNLAIRPNRAENSYRFLEPVTLELKLLNTSGDSKTIEEDMLSDGRHVTIFVQRKGGELRQLRAMTSRCHQPHLDRIEAGHAIYGAHMISTSTDGWLIDEPGFYKVQAAVDLGTEIVVSNVLRIYVAPPVSLEEGIIGGDYFTEDVGRVLAFAGAPQLAQAQDVLRRLVTSCTDNPAAVHASVALSSPLLRDFKILVGLESGNGLKIVARPAKVDEASKIQLTALLKEPDKAADTVGHIPFFTLLQHLADSIKAKGDDKVALDVMTKTIRLMKSRKILPSVIENVERQIDR